MKPDFTVLDAAFRGKWYSSTYPSFHKAVYDLHHIRNMRASHVANEIGGSKTSIMYAAKRMGCYKERTIFKGNAYIDLQSLRSLDTLKKMDKSLNGRFDRENLVEDCVHYTIKLMYESKYTHSHIGRLLGMKCYTVSDCLRRMKLIERNAAKPMSEHSVIVKPPLKSCCDCGVQIVTFKNQCNYCGGKNGQKRIQRP